MELISHLVILIHLVYLEILLDSSRPHISSSSRLKFLLLFYLDFYNISASSKVFIIYHLDFTFILSRLIFIHNLDELKV